MVLQLGMEKNASRVTILRSICMIGDRNGKEELRENFESNVEMKEERELERMGTGRMGRGLDPSPILSPCEPSHPMPDGHGPTLKRTI